MKTQYANRVLTLALAAMAAGSGGCSAISQQDYDLAVQEAKDLRDRNATLQQALDDCEGRYAALEAQRGGGAPGDLNIPGTTTRRGANGELIVEIAGDVLFDSGSVTLKSASKQTLDRVADALKGQFASNAIRVEGYTDTDPIKKSKWQTNERLSAERAMAVEAYLVSKGVDNNRVYSAAFGPARQRGSKAQSRRVEVVILGS